VAPIWGFKDAMLGPESKRVVYQDSFALAAPPAKVFPLLCPVREHEWIPTWRAQMVYSQSGFAELDCVFATEQPGEGKRTWICTRYDPPHSIAYTSFSSLGYIMRLDITLEVHGADSSRVSWSRRFIATSEEGKAWLAKLPAPGSSSGTQVLAQLLSHFLATGTMLKP
jgi:hypothetical protein